MRESMFSAFAVTEACPSCEDLKSSLHMLVINSIHQKINMHVNSILLHSVGILVWNMLVKSVCIFEITVKMFSPALLGVPAINYSQK